jgi:lipoate-protein ligase A
MPLTFAHSSWRLIKTPPAHGAWNMALDESLLEGVQIERALPVLRLYAWEPPCLSLGVAQPAADANMPALQERGWELVRRPTGGRAILHTDELTYSVIGPQTEPRLSGSVLESYQRLSLALLEALRLLSVPALSEAEPAPSDTNNPKGPICFEVPSNYEITVNGKKLIGSAQARRKAGVLQHGSLPLYGDLGRIAEVLKFASSQDQIGVSAQVAAVERLLERATTIETCLGRPITWKAASEAFAKGFQSALNLELIPSEPSNLELQRAEELVREKYAHPSWTNRI